MSRGLGPLVGTCSDGDSGSGVARCVPLARAVRRGAVAAFGRVRAGAGNAVRICGVEAAGARVGTGCGAAGTGRLAGGAATGAAVGAARAVPGARSGVERPWASVRRWIRRRSLRLRRARREREHGAQRGITSQILKG